MTLNILYEDKDILVCEKPVGVAAQNDRGFGEDMVSILMNHQKENGVKVPYVGVVHRLDKMVGGVMVYAKNKEAAASLSKQIQDGKTTKKYYAVICGDGKQLTLNTEKEEGLNSYILEDYLAKDGKTNTSRVSNKGDKQAKAAKLSVQLLETKKIETLSGLQDMTLVDIELFTGRHHQIRVQFSSRNCPLYGDAKYNPAFDVSMKSKGVALYSYLIGFSHPKTRKYMEFTNKPNTGIFNEFNL